MICIETSTFGNEMARWPGQMAAWVGVRTYERSEGAGVNTDPSCQSEVPVKSTCSPNCGETWPRSRPAARGAWRAIGSTPAMGNGVAKDDDSDHEGKGRDPERLALEGGVADLTVLEEEHRPGQLVPDLVPCSARPGGSGRAVPGAWWSRIRASPAWRKPRSSSSAWPPMPACCNSPRSAHGAGRSRPARRGRAAASDRDRQGRGDPE